MNVVFAKRDRLWVCWFLQVAATRLFIEVRNINDGGSLLFGSAGLVTPKHFPSRHCRNCRSSLLFVHSFLPSIQRTFYASLPCLQGKTNIWTLCFHSASATTPTAYSQLAPVQYGHHDQLIFASFEITVSKLKLQPQAPNTHECATCLCKSWDRNEQIIVRAVAYPVPSFLL